APRELVFEALTKPELVQRWLLGPDGWSMPVCEIDLRVGGRYRYVWRNDAKDKEMASGGVFREIVPPERIVNTEAFEDPWYQGEAVCTAQLTEKSGKTLLTQTMMFASRDARDAVLKSGMEKGVARSYDRLEEVLGATANRR